MSDLVIRRAAAEDIPDLMRIYNHAILNSTATFDIVPKTLEDRTAWFASHSDDCPLLVAELDGKAVGWADIRPYGARAAYRNTVENAIYVDDEDPGPKDRVRAAGGDRRGSQARRTSRHNRADSRRQ